MKEKNLELQYPEGATPLDKNEIQGLIPNYITLQSELDTLEHENILKAKEWLLKEKTKNKLDEIFVRKLHEKMFGDVWKWAGKYRRSEKSIGIFWQNVPTEVKKLCDDVAYWIEHKSYSWDEIGVRLHWKLVSIHPFSNGNGRHARIFTDAILSANEQHPFTWGRNLFKGEIGRTGEIRKAYIEALKECDKKNYAPLLKFVRS